MRAAAEEVPAFLKTINATLGELSHDGTEAAAEHVAEHVPAVPVRSSGKPDYPIVAANYSAERGAIAKKLGWAARVGVGAPKRRVRGRARCEEAQ